MKQDIDYRIKTQIKGERPDIQFEVIYKDDFSNDHYILKSEIDPNSDTDTNNIPFVVYKDGEQIDQINMVNRDSKKFLDEFVSLTEDDDFSKAFKNKILESSSKELNDFFEFFEDAVVLKGITLEGERKRMKRVAGILK